MLHLGHQALTGVFPKTKEEQVTVGPLELVWCMDTGLLQLNHSYDPTELYGKNYGYRSGLNQSMVDHLSTKVSYLEHKCLLTPGDVVLDIGSNDATLLKAYKTENLMRIGMDPTGIKFKQFYPPEVRLIPDFFSADHYWSTTREPAKLVTSIAMLYDLDAPVDFAKQIASILTDDGLWHFEQSYLPSMLRLNSYDTICHEHLEYYSLEVIKKIMDAADLRLIDVFMNGINGGSFAVTVTKKSNKSYKSNDAVITWLLEQESNMGLNTPKIYRNFEERVFSHRNDLCRLINNLVADGKTIVGYGASTKGNVLLQFCGFSSREIKAIAEVNQDKFNCFTPGTYIPILSENEVRAMNPDYYLVLPWHFKDNILRREKHYLANGGKLIFPFPEIEII
jgi:hypothetical protein